MSNDLGFKNCKIFLKDAFNEIRNPEQGITLPRWPLFSAVGGGLFNGDLTLLCAPTGAGKTQLIANLAAHLWSAGIRVFAAPVETGGEDFIRRMISVISEENLNTYKSKNSHEIERLNIIEKEFEKLLTESPIFISTYDSTIDIERFEAQLMFQAKNHKVKVMLLDNLNFFLKVSKPEEQNIIMDQAVRVIRNVAKVTNTHILLICHPKKTEKGRIVSEFDLKGSSTLVQEASNVILWNRPLEEESLDITDRILVFKKNRKKGDAYDIRIPFKYKNGSFIEDRDNFKQLNPRTWRNHVESK